MNTMNIPYQNIEIEQIYSQIFSAPKRSIAICSADEGEGTTSLALALAERHLMAGHSTLVVDLNLYKPSLQGLLDIETETQLVTKNLPTNLSNSIFSSVKLVTANQNSHVLTGLTAPQKRENIIKLREQGVLEQCISEWTQQFDCIIFDTSPLNRINAGNIPAERIAAACDGAILMVLAGQTREAMVTSAVNKLNTSNAKLLGCVFNDRDNPSVRNELLRMVEKLDTRFSWIARPLKKVINKNHLLTLEV